MTTTLAAPSPARVRAALKRAGNPFRNYFARNPDDDTCARYHVPELFTAERDLLLAIIDLYRYDPLTHSEVVPILGNKGAGKTHLLHSIKHGSGGAWQLVVTPGVYQKDTDFLEYLLFQMLDTLLGGGKQKGVRPMTAVGEMLVRQQLGAALKALTPEERMDLFPAPGFGKWARRLGLGTAQAQERADWLAEQLAPAAGPNQTPMPLMQALHDAGLSPGDAHALLVRHAAKTESRATAGLMREQVVQGFAKAVLVGDETDLANFLTYGFAELEFQVRPSRQDLVLALLKVVMELFRGLKVPVVVAFDQLEDLLLARRSDEGHKIAEAFFAGIVQVMHQIDGVCFLVFAERGLWNRFVPSLDGYIQDRLNNPVHVPHFGTVKAIRLEAPPTPLVRRVVEARLAPVLTESGADLGEIYPFDDEQIGRIAKTEPTLRDMLQQFRHLFDHMIYDAAEPELAHEPTEARITPEMHAPTPEVLTPHDKQSRIEALLGSPTPVEFKSVTIVETPPDPVAPVLLAAPAALGVPLVGAFPSVAASASEPAAAVSRELPPATLVADPTPAGPNRAALMEMWETEFRAAKRRLEPEGALTGSTRELQAALGVFLTTCHENGVKVGAWRLQHVVPEYPFGDHPTYGAVALAHWACQDGQPWRVAVGLFLAKGAGKPKDLEIKLGVADQKPQVVDHTILLRQEDDATMTGKSKTVWQDAEKRGHHARIEAVSLETYALLQSVPRWLNAVRESLPTGAPMPNLADVIQERAERLLEQVCMPVTL